MIGLGLDGYDPDSGHEAAAAFRIQVVADEQYIPRHQHRKGQLILALHGALTCEVENAMWMVPPQYAVWVPGQVPHSNRATPEAQVCFLFIEPHAAPMPDFCCTLKISPLVRELILVMAERGRAELAKPAMNAWCRCCSMNSRSSRRSTCSSRSPGIQKFVRWWTRWPSTRPAGKRWRNGRRSLP